MEDDQTQTTAAERVAIEMEAAYAIYQDRLGNLTTREEDAHRKAFLSGWYARDKLEAESNVR
jgi:hypothetical protein